MNIRIGILGVWWFEYNYCEFALEWLLDIVRVE